MTQKPKTRFRLWPYVLLSKRWFMPAFWLIPGGVALWWAAPNLPRHEPSLAFLPLGISGIGVLLVIYTIIARQANITCKSNRFVVHTPFYPVAFSYHRIEMIRPMLFNNIFPPQQEKRARLQMYYKLWGQTVIVISLNDYPLPRWWMKFWFHPYLLHPQERALVLPVDDWMGLSRQLEVQRARLREQPGRRRANG
ncbi:MAG TPA: hypothetical protein PKH77_07455 [Anaerolineae bacterium]|nr:hypothetical protein [Anaerolineae bacterium]